MEQPLIEIVPAQPGFFTVYEFEKNKEFEVGEPVIAWRIKTVIRDYSSEAFSSCFPITADGDAADNCVGVQNPDMTVTIFDHTTYGSIKEAQEDKYSKT